MSVNLNKFVTTITCHVGDFPISEFQVKGHKYAADIFQDALAGTFEPVATTTQDITFYATDGSCTVKIEIL